MNATRILIPTLATLGLLAGGLAGYLKQQEQIQPADTETPQQVTELKTDPFSLQLFKHALHEKTGNVLVAPHAMTHTLAALKAIAAGKTLEELNSLQLTEQSIQRSAEPLAATLLAMDYNLPRTAELNGVIPLPFSDNLPMALSLFNGMLAPATANATLQMADSNMVTSRTRLLAGCASHCRLDWEHPFHPANSCTADFDSASGGMPHFHQMRSRGMYRMVRAADNSWQAVVLPFKAQGSDKHPSLVFIGILPAGDARTFGTELTPEQLTSIRKELSAATPEDTLVELPRLEQIVLPYDMRDSLRRLGLKALFDTEAADFSPLTPQKIHLGAFIQSISVHLTESATKVPVDDALNYAARVISFTRPFIWLITDLDSNTPVDYFGLVEEI